MGFATLKKNRLDDIGVCFSIDHQMIYQYLISTFIWLNVMVYHLENIINTVVYHTGI